jgi:23S rRNA (adenine2503-C2)-methyltransferase
MSVSLHAPNDELRSRLMPVNRRYPLAQLLAACQEYFAATKRLITFEYTLVRGLNDRPEHARELARILGGFPCRVNLIPLSPVAEFQGEAAAPETADMFIETLERAGVNATFRSSKGSAIQAACGQLRFRKQGTEEDSTQESGNRIQ